MLSTSILIFILCFVAGFISMLLVFTPIANKYMRTLQIKPTMLPFSYILLFYILGTICLYFGIERNDFIEDLTAVRTFVPLLLAFVIFIASMLSSGKVFMLTIIGCVAATVWMQPLGDGFPFPNIPVWAARLLLIIIFSIFCIFYGVLNYLPQTMIIPSIFTLFGIAGLAAFSAAPVYLACCSSLLIGALSGYFCINLNTVKIPFDNGSCSALAYLITSLILLDSGEYSLSSCFIFCIFFWCELAVAIWNKFLITKTGSLAESTFCAQAAQKVSMQALIVNVAKICTISLFIGWFQIFSVNQYSLILISFAIVLWLNHSMLHPFNNSLKSINREFMSDLRQNISELQDNFKSIQKNKSDTAKKRTAKTSVKKNTRKNSAKKTKGK